MSKAIVHLETVDLRLATQFPDVTWNWTGDYVCYKGSVWLHYAVPEERRMYWVAAKLNGEVETGEIIRTWDFGEIADFV